MISFDVTCPECEWKFKIQEPLAGEVLACEDCGLNLKILSINAEEESVLVELTDTREDDWGQ